jgi:hypothetical protein
VKELVRSLGADFAASARSASCLAARRAWSITAVAAFAGCAPAVLSIDAEPKNALVLVDGEPRGTPPVRVRAPYYGTSRVELLPPQAEGPPYWHSVSRMVAIEPPAPPWLFPFDLLIELAGYPWRDRDTRVALQAEPRDVPAAGERPPTGELRESALRALTLR